MFLKILSCYSILAKYSFRWYAWYAKKNKTVDLSANGAPGILTAFSPRTQIPLP